MRINNLYEGQVIKNYKELCGILEESIKGGKSKQLQIKEFERYFEYHKEGNKFVIDKIFLKPKEKMNTKSSNGIMSRINQGEYSKEVFPLVKNFVCKNENIEYISKGKLLKILKLKNNNYDIAREYPKEVAEYLSKELNINITKEDIEFITYAIYNNATEKINNAFKNLEKMKYIYGYTDKLLTIYSDYKVIIPTNGISQKIENNITTSRLNILKNYYFEKGLITDCDEYLLELKEEFNNDFNLINKELKIQVFLSGLYDKVKLDALYNINMCEYYDKKIENYYYSYGYIRNEDIEWDKELLTLAEENLHRNNYKEKVRNEYLSNTFANRIEKELNKKKIGRLKSKTIIRNELIKHLNEFNEKSSVLFDLFTDEYPVEDLSICNIFYDDNIPF